METALLAAISMRWDLLQKIEEPASLPAASDESDRKPDGRIAPLSQLLGFHQDDEGHWVAELSCGHTQHLRHLPPWQNRGWVEDPQQRQQRIGQPFACGWCQAELEGRAYKAPTMDKE
ncbi:MAG TPA: DUF3565 domain-containing protein [Pseudomonas sp.]|nr:DUF3565 domain-containing protein [Pseudomonas sp.]